MAAGDVRAIGDWFRGTRYLKDDVDELFLLNNQYTAYYLTFMGFDVNSELSVTGKTSDRSYNIKIRDLDGLYDDLFFFDQGEDIDVYDGVTLLKTHTLNNSKDTVKNYDPEIVKVYNPDTTITGSYSTKTFEYTITEGGMYAIHIMGEWGANYKTPEITPSRSPIMDLLDEAWGGPWYQGTRVMIYNFQKGDKVSVTMGSDSNCFNFLAIYHLKTIYIDENSSLLWHQQVSDGTLSRQVPNDGKKHLLFAITRGNSSPSDVTDISQKHGEAYTKNNPGCKSYASVYYGDYSNLPVVKVQGWSGGMMHILDITL